VIKAAEKVTRRSIRVEYGERRAGDPPRLVADSRMIQKDLGWTPRYPDIETIINHAWKFESKLNRGNRLG
jgi:UDP-glucose 4-epimerase